MRRTGSVVAVGHAHGRASGIGCARRARHGRKGWEKGRSQSAVLSNEKGVLRWPLRVARRACAGGTVFGLRAASCLIDGLSLLARSSDDELSRFVRRRRGQLPGGMSRPPSVALPRHRQARVRSLFPPSRCLESRFSGSRLCPVPLARRCARTSTQVRVLPLLGRSEPDCGTQHVSRFELLAVVPYDTPSRQEAQASSPFGTSNEGPGEKRETCKPSETHHRGPILRSPNEPKVRWTGRSLLRQPRHRRLRAEEEDFLRTS